ncbi:hypothetical protein V4C53_33460 [Paraburkholderia azotifigens]|uniref:hypothetical protein n=1 Tax=Paraburkholderia azotifigens TaxID=2057004 RepID=UPI00316E0A94
MARPSGNLGLYRLYLITYFRDHPMVRRYMPLVIDNCSPASPSSRWRSTFTLERRTGNSTKTCSRTCVDHAYGVAPQFGLRCWQPQWLSSSL